MLFFRYFFLFVFLVFPSLSFAQKFDYSLTSDRLSQDDFKRFEKSYQTLIKSLIFYGWTGQSWSVQNLSNVLAYDKNLIPYEFLAHDEKGLVILNPSRFENYRIYGPHNSFALLSSVSSGRGFSLEWKNFPKSYCLLFLEKLEGSVLFEVNGRLEKNKEQACSSRYDVLTLAVYYSDVEKFIESIQKEAASLRKT